MTATSVHFRVGNGDMTLFELDGGKTLLVDTNITAAADDPNDYTPDVASQLRKRLKRDAQGRLFVDAFLLTHPDFDHCRGLIAHFHLGPLNEWSAKDDKIVIREMWSSPIVFRRASRKHTLGDDAKAWACEARRRVKRFRERGYLLEGDRIRILGEDINGKTDDLGAILVRCNGEFTTIAGETGNFTARLMAPMAPAGDELEEQLSKNDSSVIIGLSLTADYKQDAARYLLGGDAEVLIWERVWERNKHQVQHLEYDVLLAPHHCSWHSLSWYSWSLWGEEAEVSEDARSALSQARGGATILSSSKPVEDDKDERIATFDNDGTLWAEQPVYFQLQFALDEIRRLASEQPELKGKQPYRSVLARDLKGLAGDGGKGLQQVIAATHTGMTTDAFAAQVRNWLDTARHPTKQRPYTEMVYQPQIELLAHLRANGFKTFIVSGGGVEFMRAFAEKTYGIPPEQVVGSSGVVTFRLGADGKPELFKGAKVEFVDDGPGKPVGINRFVGRRPILAFGNSDGDLQMLQYTVGGSGPRLALIVHHTDAEREWAYDRASHIGKLDKALDEGRAKGWTIVDMKTDWKTIFPEGR